MFAVDHLCSEWQRLLQEQFKQPYCQQLQQFLLQRQSQATVYPAVDDWFNAFALTPFQQVKVVILGQDPYHGPNQANGLSFSVQKEQKLPPSLRNIFKELVSDAKVEPPAMGDLTPWAEQGVLLLNTVLTVEHKRPNSHAGQGWEQLTDAMIQAVNKQLDGVVFVLWGKPAQRKAAMVDESRHLVLAAPHPSPLSAYRGFFDSRPFSQANEYLMVQGKQPIDWALPSAAQQSLW